MTDTDKHWLTDKLEASPAASDADAFTARLAGSIRTERRRSRWIRLGVLAGVTVVVGALGAMGLELAGAWLSGPAAASPIAWIPYVVTGVLAMVLFRAVLTELECRCTAR